MRSKTAQQDRALKQKQQSREYEKNGHAERLADLRERTEVSDLKTTAASATASRAMWAMVFKFRAALNPRTQSRSCPVLLKREL